MPVLRAAIHTEEKSPGLQLILENQQGTQVWPQKLSYFHVAGGADTLDIEYPEQTRIGFGLDYSVSSYLLPNVDGRGYGYFPVDMTSRLEVLDSGYLFEEPAGRAALWINLWEDVLRSKLRPAQLLGAGYCCGRNRKRSFDSCVFIGES